MRCYICDISMDVVTTDARTGKIRHCWHCEAAIQECLDFWRRKQDDEDPLFGEYPMLDDDFDYRFEDSHIPNLINLDLDDSTDYSDSY